MAKASTQFAVVEDRDGKHMIFTTDESGRLYLIVKGEQGQSEIIDLGQKFGFTQQQSISTLAVSQNLDGTIHLVFAVQEIGKANLLFVLRPMAPQMKDWLALSGRGHFYAGPQWDITIKELLLVSPDLPLNRCETLTREGIQQ